MSPGDVFTRCAMTVIPDYIEGLLAELAGKGIGGNIVRDQNDQLSPPEAAVWTGKRYQLALCWSGLNVWLELRHRLPQGWVCVGEPRHNRGDFTSFICRFAQWDDAS